MSTLPPEEPVFQVSGLSSEDRSVSLRFRTIVQQLGGLYLDLEDRSGAPIPPPECTHLILLRRVKSEKLLLALASGAFVVDEAYLEASSRSGHWLDARDYDLGGFGRGEREFYFERYVRRRRDKDRGGKFRGWRVVLGLEKKRSQTFRRLLMRGGAEVLPDWDGVDRSDLERANLLVSEPTMMRQARFGTFLSQNRALLVPTSTLYVSEYLLRSHMDRKSCNLNNPAVQKTYLEAGAWNPETPPGSPMVRTLSRSIMPMNCQDLNSLPSGKSISAMGSRPIQISPRKKIHRRVKMGSPEPSLGRSLSFPLSSNSDSSHTSIEKASEYIKSELKQILVQGALKSRDMDSLGPALLRNVIIVPEFFPEEQEPANEYFFSSIKTYTRGEFLDAEDNVSLWMMVITFLDLSLARGKFFDHRMINELVLNGLVNQRSRQVQLSVHGFLLKLISTIQAPSAQVIRTIYLNALTYHSVISKPEKSEPWEFIAAVARDALEPRGSNDDDGLGCLLTLDFVSRLIVMDYKLSLCRGHHHGDRLLVSSIFWPSSHSSNLSIPRSLRELVTFYSTSLQLGRLRLFRCFSAILEVVASTLPDQSTNQLKCDFALVIARAFQSLGGHSSRENDPTQRLVVQALCLLAPNWLSLLVTLQYNGINPDAMSLRQLLVDCASPSERKSDILNNNQPLPEPGRQGKKTVKRNAYGETPLHLACQKDQWSTVQAILSRNEIGVNLTDHNGWTALHEACMRGSVESVKALMATRDPHVNLMAFGGGEERATPLQRAIEEGHCEVVEIILNLVHQSQLNGEHHRPPMKHLLNPDGKSLSLLATNEAMKTLLARYSALDEARLRDGADINGHSWNRVESWLIHLSLRRYLASFSLNLVKQELKNKPVELKRFAKPLTRDPTTTGVLKSSYPLHRSDLVVAQDLRSFNDLKSTPFPPTGLALSQSVKMLTL